MTARSNSKVAHSDLSSGCSYRASSTVCYLLAGEAEFEFTRSTIDDGGVMRSTGGEFELSGTIGRLMEA